MRDGSLALLAMLASAPPGQHYELAMHLISAHADPRAVCRSYVDNADVHQHEHDGPGTIRNHERGRLNFSEAKIEEVLEELEAEYDGWCRRLTLGNREGIQEWMSGHGVSSHWSHDLPRLSFGGRLGSFSIPPGWWVIVSGDAAEASEQAP